MSVVTADQITAQGAQSIGQALRYTPGVSSETLGVGDFTSTFIRQRGYVADLYLDGLRLPRPPASAAYAEVEPYNVERVESLRGPSSGLYGASGPGGIINMVSKRPLDKPFHEIAVQGGSFDRKQVQFDFSDRINGNPDALFRVVGLARDSNHQVDYLQDSRQFIAPSITVRNEQTSLTAMASYFHADNRFNLFNYLPASGMILPNQNGRLSQSLYLGNPNYDRIKREQFTAGYAFEHRFDEMLTFRQNFRFVQTDNDLLTSAIARPSNSLATGNDPRTGLALGDASLQTVRLGTIAQYAHTEQFTLDNQLEARFSTGPFSHTAVVGYDYRDVDATYLFLSGGGTAFTLNLYNPVYNIAATQPPTGFLQNDAYKQQHSAIYFQDQIKFDRWILTLGGRQDWAESLTNNKLGNLGFRGPDDSAFTGRAALAYQFDNGITPYVTYGTSFEPIIGTAFGGVPLRPTTGAQYEGGVKYQPPGTRTLLTAAVFDLTQQNVLTPDPVNAGFSIQTGEIHTLGAEFEARTELTDNFSLIAAYTYLDATVTVSNRPGEVGTTPNYNPRNAASVWGQYKLDGDLRGVTVGGGVRYVSSREAWQPAVNYGGVVGNVPAFTLVTPGYTLFDMMVSYDFAYLSPAMKGTNLRINATNLFDTWHVAGCNSIIQCSQGIGRTVLATLSYKW